MIAFPRRHLAALEDLAAHVLEKRGVRARPETLARDLLGGFHELCMGHGLDGIVLELDRSVTPLEPEAVPIDDEAVLSEELSFRDPLAARLSSKESFDPGGPRPAMLRQLADAVVASLSLSPYDPEERTITLADAALRELDSAMATAIEPALAPPKLREAIISTGRELCQPLYLDAFDEIAPQLDVLGTRVPPQRDMPLHAVQAVKRTLLDGKADVVERAAHDAIDRAKRVLLRASADAAGRLDEPISHRLTPRDVAIRRLAKLRIPKPEAVVPSLLASLTELLELAWEDPEPAARAYSPRESFAVGDLLDHPTFGCGTVEAAWETSVEVEFEDGSWRTLVHGRSR